MTTTSQRWTTSGLLVFLALLVARLSDVVNGLAASPSSSRRRGELIRNLRLPPLQPVSVSTEAGNDDEDFSSVSTESTKLAKDGIVRNDGAQNPWRNPIEVVYTNSARALRQWLDENVPRQGCTLGVDVESSPDLPWRRAQTFTGPATVQLATHESAIVIHFVKTDSSEGGPAVSKCWSILESVFANPDIVKAGCGIDDDFLELHYERPIKSVRCRFEMGGIGGSVSKRVGIKYLTESLLGVELSKSRKLAMSDWSKVPLSANQIGYCARDAWAAAAVCKELERRDSSRFSTMALKKALQPNEEALTIMAAKARRKKEAKTEWKDLREELKQLKKRNGSSNSKMDRMNSRIDFLFDAMVANSKQQPLFFDLEDCIAGSGSES